MKMYEQNDYVNRSLITRNKDLITENLNNNRYIVPKLYF